MKSRQRAKLTTQLLDNISRVRVELHLLAIDIEHDHVTPQGMEARLNAAKEPLDTAAKFARQLYGANVSEANVPAQPDHTQE